MRREMRLVAGNLWVGYYYYDACVVNITQTAAVRKCAWCRVSSSEYLWVPSRCF